MQRVLIINPALRIVGDLTHHLQVQNKREPEISVCIDSFKHIT